MDAAAQSPFTQTHDTSLHAHRQKEGWMSTAEPFVVDSIVAALKNHASPKFCWHRTGPSLRLLNKHWCQEMKRHVTAITLKNQLEEEAFHSLLKFPNLTSLNISRFEPLEKCGLLMRTIRRLPNLTQLKLSLDVLKSLNKDDLDGLACKTIDLRPTYLCPSDVDELIKLSNTQAEHVDLGYADDGMMNDFLAASLSVKSLSIEVDECRSDLQLLAALDELNLDYAGDNLHSLAALTCLVSLRMDDQIHTFEPFGPLMKLRELDVEIIDDFVFDQTFYDVIGRLTRLAISGGGIWPDSITLPDPFWTVAVGFDELFFETMIVDTNAFYQLDFRRMKKLHLHRCALIGELIPWNRLTALTRLELSYVWGPDRSPILGTMDLSPLKNLRDLRLSFSDTEDVSLPFLQSIKQLTNLEDLDLIMAVRARLKHLDVLTSLKELPHLMDESIQRLESFVQSSLAQKSWCW